MHRFFSLVIIASTICTLYNNPVRADLCQTSHDGCMRGCEPIENRYYQAQCHAACGSGLACCRN